jgi:hypothetical protein
MIEPEGTAVERALTITERKCNMTITRQTILLLASLALTAGSLFMLADTVRLIAEWRMNVFSGIFVANACVLGAVVFAYRAKEATHDWPLSIVAPENGR